MALFINNFKSCKLYGLLLYHIIAQIHYNNRMQANRNHKFTINIQYSTAFPSYPHTKPAFTIRTYRLIGRSRNAVGFLSGRS
jgi:hypothetical protein